jgi:hypothetical protein
MITSPKTIAYCSLAILIALYVAGAVSVPHGLFLLGWARTVSGRFSPTEIAMTIVVGVAAIVGMTACARWRTSMRWSTAAVTFLLFAALQVLAFRLSLFPYIARR